MKKIPRLDYAFAVGRVRALEKHLVSRAVFREAVEAMDFVSAIKVVFDAGRFSEELIDVKNSEELDDFLAKEEKTLHEEIGKLLLEEELMDIISDERRPDQLLPFVLSSSYPFLIDYIKHRIDLGNIKIMLRLKYAALPGDRLKSLLMKGGFVEESTLLHSFDLSYSEIGDKLYASPYPELWAEAVEKMEEQESFVALERAIESFLMKHLRKARYIVFGPEPVLAYGIARKRELSHVRILGIGKLNHIPSAILSERLGDTYV
jgi:V/A-type H+-transporting ATPase subunit C